MNEISLVCSKWGCSDTLNQLLLRRCTHTRANLITACWIIYCARSVQRSCELEFVNGAAGNWFRGMLIKRRKGKGRAQARSKFPYLVCRQSRTFIATRCHFFTGKKTETNVGLVLQIKFGIFSSLTMSQNNILKTSFLCFNLCVYYLIKQNYRNFTTNLLVHKCLNSTCSALSMKEINSKSDISVKSDATINPFKLVHYVYCLLKIDGFQFKSKSFHGEF